MPYKIDFSPPDIGSEEIAAVTEVLRSGWITTGPKTKEFERALADYCSTNMAVCLNSATAALELTLRLFGIGKGDEVITTAYTYTATASVICHVGATPVFIDTAKDSYHIDCEKLKGAITAKTKAIIGVDIAGMLCDYDKLIACAKDSMELFVPNGGMQQALGRAVVIADAAHSLGAAHGGKRSGSLADFTCFSFHAVKNLTTGEGGAVTWLPVPGVNDSEIYRIYMLLSLHGQSKDALAKTQLGTWEYDIIAPAFKCNMTDITAAIGVEQLKRYPRFLERRMQLADLYSSELAGVAELPRHKTGEDISSAHLYPVRLNNADEHARNAVIEKLAALGIPANVHFKPLPMYTAYKRLGFDINDYPNAYRQYQNELTLPLHTKLSDDDALFVARSLKKIVQ